ncbi:DUF5994 family protein [Actinophytocola sp.]|uniref:DUF5994 family protein n=1 Tax=Actinophytocola sp. TaxID=1872138 RepID=UPI002ED7B17F
MKPAAPTTGTPGFVDGAWWPRSRDVSAELPTLLPALAVRLGQPQRMADDDGTTTVLARRAPRSRDAVPRPRRVPA